MCFVPAMPASGVRCSGQAVCVAPGRRGFGRKLAHGPVIAGERQLGAACWEPFGWVEWFGTAPRKGRPRESPYIFFGGSGFGESSLLGRENYSTLGANMK